METKTQGTDLRTQWGKERVGRGARAAWEHALPCGQETPAGICCATREPKPALPTASRGRTGTGWEEVQEGGTRVCLRLIQLLQAETNTGLESTHPPIRNK